MKQENSKTIWSNSKTTGWCRWWLGQNHTVWISHVSYVFSPVTSLHCSTLHYTGYTDILSIFRRFRWNSETATLRFLPSTALLNRQPKAWCDKVAVLEYDIWTSRLAGLACFTKARALVKWNQNANMWRSCDQLKEGTQLFGWSEDSLHLSESLAICVLRCIRNGFKHTKPWSLSSTQENSTQVRKAQKPTVLVNWALVSREANFEAQARYIWSLIKHWKHRHSLQPYVAMPRNAIIHWYLHERTPQRVVHLSPGMIWLTRNDTESEKMCETMFMRWQSLCDNQTTSPHSKKWICIEMLCLLAACANEALALQDVWDDVTRALSEVQDFYAFYVTALPTCPKAKVGASTRTSPWSRNSKDKAWLA